MILSVCYPIIYKIVYLLLNQTEGKSGGVNFYLEIRALCIMHISQKVKLQVGASF